MNTNVISFSSKKKYKTGTSPEDKLSNSSAISQANAQSQLPASYQDKQYLDYQDQRVKYPLNQQPLEK